MESTINLTDQERFFYEHAGWSYDPKRETPEEGRAHCAIALAAAERDAQTKGWYFEWEYDDSCAGCDCGDSKCPCFRSKGRVTNYHRPFFCSVYDAPGGNMLGSLHGICEPTPEYRRVIQAELALEASS